MTFFANTSTNYSSVERWSRHVLRFALGLVFIYAAYRKLSEPWIAFAAAVDSYGIVPSSWAPSIARTLPWFEGLLGVALVAGYGLRIVALAAAALLGGFFGLMAYSYAIGKSIDCGCFGSGEALGPATLTRDGALVVVAFALLFLANRARRLRKLDETAERC